MQGSELLPERSVLRLQAGQVGALCAELLEGQRIQVCGAHEGKEEGENIEG